MSVTRHPIRFVIEAKKRREELEKELTDINRGREDDGYIPGVYEPEYGH